MTILDATATSPATPASPARAPEDLLEQFAVRVAAADLDGIVELYAADAVVSLPRGREAAGHAAIRAAFAAALAAGVDLDVAQVCPPIVSGSLACTSATTPAGLVRTQVARREPDGGWRWVRDGFRLREAIACLPAMEVEGAEVA
ncbi:MAG TPA: nuclear transport factor 2 family protein [Intrasporangium sp.]|uniref:nuclear transport factor 2 family protein n=1 Tax=Intrasporangium sp. TaxID=1925024 RepID=UPI002D77A830|nr:nuclear transport factor 2 family protein [Intrasporangium sp.]HET7398258.1 nuclear transport factor 2 family protein [Intrasporangium sp.]